MARAISIIGGTYNPRPRPSAYSYNERLAGLSALLQWLVPDEQRVTLEDGRIAQLADRCNAGKSGSQSDATRRPLWVANGAPFNRPSMLWEAGRFDRLGTSVVMPSGPTAVWSKVAYVKPALGIPYGTYWDILSSASLSGTTTGPHRLSVYGGSTTANIRARVGGSNLAQVTQSIPADEWIMIVNTWNGPENTLGLSINGASFVKTTVAGAQSDETQLNIGSCGSGTNYRGHMGNIMPFALDLSAPGNASLLETLKQFSRDRFRVSIA